MITIKSEIVITAKLGTEITEFIEEAKTYMNKFHINKAILSFGNWIHLLDLKDHHSTKLIESMYYDFFN